MRLEALLLPLAPLYAFAVRARVAAYGRGWLRRERLPLPAISVGNLTFGGTGKTPLVAALVRDLARRGRRPAVLTRGYGRRGREPLVLVGPGVAVPAERAGDEPLELARRLPGVPVVVDADRVRGAHAARSLGADVAVLDDAFQHLRVERDLDVVAVDAGDPWGGGRLPPLGRLREPVEALARAHAVVVTKLPRGWARPLRAIAARVEELAPGIPVVGSRLEPVRVRTPEGVRGPEVLAGARVVALAAVGRPDGFVATLEELGAEVVGRRFHPDHHRYRGDDVAGALAAARRLGAVVVTTGKDAVKLPAEAPVWVLEVEAVPVDGSWDALWAQAPGVTA